MFRSALVLVTGLILLGCKPSPSSWTMEVVDRSDGTLPEMTVPKLVSRVTIDGRNDEWPKNSGISSAFVTAQDGHVAPDSPVLADVQLGWNDGALYFFFRVQDRHASSPFEGSERDVHVWAASTSAVEIMLQPGDPGTNKNYFEIQVDVAGARWDTRFDDYMKPLGESDGKKTFGYESWDSRAESAVQKSDEGYSMEVAVPWSALSAGGTGAPPTPNEVWRANFYSFRDKQRQALAWSPLKRKGNFHKASRFGRLLFGGLKTSKRALPASP